MEARKRELDRPERFPVGHRGEPGDSPVEGEVARGDVGLRRQAEGDHPALDERPDLLHVRVVEAQQRGTEERDGAGEPGEGVL